METIPEDSIAECLDFFNELPRNCVEGHMRDTSNEYDHTYIHHDLETGNIKLGDSIVEFKGPDRGFKYKNIIKPILEQMKQQDIDKQKEHSRKLRVGRASQQTEISKKHTEKNGFGRASPTLVTYNEKPIEYIYWDDVNELVERLKLLVASKHAGNTSNDNEITAIINELKEAGVIY
ncbi:unnamed protein product [Brassicogethes aeneus]|uniref:Uncharacterized protein n=1 Tax=Brassicogethes aeneus TaxID=1431903 RepID=A0A9P0AZV2_BRAAE|nr:unnamed protein product [Brassicogethes aeneus]